LFRKPEGKRPPGISRYRWEDNIEIDLKERRWKYGDWIHFTHDGDQRQALLNTVLRNMALQCWVPCKVISLVAEQLLAFKEGLWCYYNACCLSHTC